MKNKFFYFLLMFSMTISSFVFLFGCGNVSGGGGGGGSSETPLTKLYIASQNNKVHVFNLETLSTEEPIVFPGSSTSIRGIAVSPDKQYLYAADEYNSKLYKYNIATGALNTAEVNTALLDKFGYYLAVSPDGSRVFIGTGSDKNGIFAFTTDPFTLEACATVEIGVPTGEVCFGIAVSSDNNYAYVASCGGHHIFKYNVASKTIEAVLDLTSSCLPAIIAFNPAGNLLYVPIWYSEDTVVTVNPTTLSLEAAHIHCSEAAYHIAFVSSSKAYVANFETGASNDHISVVDVANNTVEATIPQTNNSRTCYVVVDNSRNRAYVNHQNNGILTVIDTLTDTLSATYEIGSGTTDQMAAK
jgi:DNA-binding beta-propeller fold protein YncE